MSDIRLRRIAKQPSQNDRACPRLEKLEDRTLFSVDLSGTIEGIPIAGYYPPDTIGAAGLEFNGEAINLQLRFWDKYSNALIMNQSLTSFFNGVLGGGVLQGSDPVMTYDVFTGQFVIGMLDYNTSNQSRFDIAISNDDDPRDGWYGAGYNMNDGVGGFDFADYPKLGYNQDAYVVTCNMFPNLSSYNHVNLLSIDKTNLSNSYRVAVPGGTGHFTMNPVVNRDANPGDPLWLVETSGSSALRLTQVSNLTSGPTFGSSLSVGVPSFGSMPTPRQPGGHMSWTFDTRLLNASEIYGQILTGHNTGIGGNARARVYQIDVSSSSPVLAQTFTIDPGNGVDTYFPAEDMNYEGDVGITYIESSSSEYMSMYVTGQNINDSGAWGSGAYQTPVVARAGTGTYTLSRAGDYAGLTVDPADGYSFWAANEYRGSSSFNTAIAAFGVSPAPGASGPGLRHVPVSLQAPSPSESGATETITAVTTPMVAQQLEQARLVQLAASSVFHDLGLVLLSKFGDGDGDAGAWLDAADLDRHAVEQAFLGLSDL
jgi:hypothetical protein